MSYENNTGIPLYVTESNGKSFILEPKKHRVISPTAISVYVTYKAPAGTANLTPLAEAFSDVVFRSMCNEIRQCGEATLMYVVEDPVPILRGDAVILTELGLAFSNRPIEINRAPLVKSHGERATMTLGVVVVQSRDDPRMLSWVRYYTSMVEVTPIRSKFYDAGVYMVMMTGETVEGGRLLRFEFDDPLSPFRVFESEEDAREFRWMSDAVPELRTLKEQLENKIRQAEELITDRKANQEYDHRQRMNDLAFNKEEVLAYFRDMDLSLKYRADERKDTFEERSLARKDVYDERTTVRKDSSEVRKDQYDSRSILRKDGSDFMKSIPTYLAAGMTLLAMMK